MGDPSARERRALVLANPVAGRGRGLVVAQRGLEVLSERGYEARLATTEGPGHARTLATELVADPRGVPDRVVVVGGDGTLRECVAGLGDGCTLGFVPLGNANVVARELALPLDPERALAVAIDGAPRVLDTLRANGTLVLAVVGLGLDARVVRRVAAARRGRWLARWYRWHADSLYVVLGALALLGRHPRLRWSLDGEPSERTCASLVACNLETYAKGWSMVPGADPADGRLDFVARDSDAPWSVLRASWAARRRRRLSPARAHYGRGSRLVVEGEGPLDWQVDGDPMPPAERVEVTVAGRFALRVPGAGGASAGGSGARDEPGGR